MAQEPEVLQRVGVDYLAIPKTVTMETIDQVVEQEFPRLFRWLESHQVKPTGAPFIRYLVIDMMQDLEIELAVGVDQPVETDDVVRSGSLPGGEYVVLRHTGTYEGLLADNGRLLDWAGARDIEFDKTSTPQGDAWAGRIESYVVGGQSEPDPNKWQTDIAMKTRTS